MTKHLHHKLLKKGWTLEEIEKLSKITKEAKERKTPFVKFLDKSVYWLFLAITIIGNLVASIILVPFMFFFTGFALYSVAAILGIALGLFMDHIIHDIEQITTKHHVFAVFSILSLAIVSVVYMTMFTKNLIIVAGLKTEQQPLTIAIVYTVALILPYLSTKIMRIKK